MRIVEQWNADENFMSHPFFLYFNPSLLHPDGIDYSIGGVGGCVLEVSVGQDRSDSTLPLFHILDYCEQCTSHASIRLY